MPSISLTWWCNRLKMVHSTSRRGRSWEIRRTIIGCDIISVGQLIKSLLANQFSLFCDVCVHSLSADANGLHHWFYFTFENFCNLMFMLRRSLNTACMYGSTGASILGNLIYFLWPQETQNTALPYISQTLPMQCQYCCILIAVRTNWFMYCTHFTYCNVCLNIVKISDFKAPKDAMSAWWTSVFWIVFVSWSGDPLVSCLLIQFFIIVWFQLFICFRSADSPMTADDSSADMVLHADQINCKCLALYFIGLCVHIPAHVCSPTLPTVHIYLWSWSGPIVLL
jgi:hypothetical protein